MVVAAVAVLVASQGLVVLVGIRERVATAQVMALEHPRQAQEAVVVEVVTMLVPVVVEVEAE
jgi:hypothetical protein